MKRGCGHVLMPSHFFPDLATVCHEFCKIKFRWAVPEMNLHSSEAVGMNSWSSWKWTTTNSKNKVNECNYKTLQMWLGADTHKQHGGTAYQSTVKLERSSYTVGLVVLTRQHKIVPIWICTGVLEHTVLHTAVSTQTSDRHDTSIQVLLKQYKKLKSLCAVVTDTWWWIQLIVGIIEAMQRGKDWWKIGPSQA